MHIRDALMNSKITAAQKSIVILIASEQLTLMKNFRPEANGGP
jgi:hypothetical protein